MNWKQIPFCLIFAVKIASHFRGENKNKTRNFSRVKVTIAFNLAEPVLPHCGCSQVTPENTQFWVEQSESVGQHRHLVGICNYNTVLPPSSFWFGPTHSAPLIWYHTPGKPSSESPRWNHMRALLFELPHDLHHHLGQSTVPSGLPDLSGQIFRDRAAPTIPSPTKSEIFLFGTQ